MDKEIDDQMGNAGWELEDCAQVSSYFQRELKLYLQPVLWAMRRKRCIKTNEVYRWKARLNIDGSKQIKGVPLWETYSLVVSWLIMRLLLLALVLADNGLAFASN